jgi:hypothetical protein
MAPSDSGETANQGTALQSQKTGPEEGDLANRAAPAQAHMRSSAPTVA